jgi:hypothetical protein
VNVKGATLPGSAPGGDDGLHRGLVAFTRPPAWLIGVTALLALGVLAMAVAETNLWLHYLIDAGEAVSLAGLAFVAAAGVYLFTRQQLRVSLPLVAPWLLFPVITQGDQIIDNLSIGWMRAVVHVLLGLIFGIPVAVVVSGVVSGVRSLVTAERTRASVQRSRWLAVLPGVSMMAEGRVREGRAVLAVFLLTLLMWVAVQFLGALMVITLILMIWGVLVFGFGGVSDTAAVAAAMPASGPGPGRAGKAGSSGWVRSERAALGLLVVGIVLSLGLYFGYKNRPGAYQGSPSYYMDPAQRDGGFRLDRVQVPTGPAVSPADPAGTRRALTGYARAFERLVAGYYILDRNYNYHFHNRLFLRGTPLLANYRQAGLSRVAEAEVQRAEADRDTDRVRAALGAEDPLAALLDDVRGYAAFTFGRTPVLARMSGEFERTEAGLQHATHLFEGEGKVMGVQLADLLAKHQRVLSSATVADVTADFVTISRTVHDLYANRVVGF